MQFVALTYGALALVGGFLVYRNYEIVVNFFRDRRRAVTGRGGESQRFSRPGIMKAVGVGWMALGALCVAAGILYH